MPLYIYFCSACLDSFETNSIPWEPIICPNCGTTRVDGEISVTREEDEKS